MPSTLYRRLQGLFSGNTTSTTITLKPTKGINLTPTSSIISQRKTATIDIKFIVDKFKKDSDSESFRSLYNNYKYVVLCLSRAKEFSYIEDILEHQKKYEEDITRESFVVRLISLYGKAGMFENAYKLFDEMPQLNCTRTVMSFNALLDACVNSKEFDKISELFRDLPDKLSIEPNTISYNTVIKACCEMGSIDSALLVVDTMEKNGCEPDLITFNTIIVAFYQKSKFSDAEKVWALMESNNIVPNVRSYNPKLRALVADKRMSEAIKLTEEMERRGVKPDVYTFNGLIQGFCKDGNLVEVKRWYGEIAKNDLVPDRVTYWMVIPFACNKGDLGFAFELCKEALSQKCDIGETKMQHLLDGLVKESKMDEAKELVELSESSRHLQYKLKLPKMSSPRASTMFVDLSLSE